MKRSVIGILAHVDSGKTTLSEALLFGSGTIRKAGRVDHRDSFLDTDVLERERGITIFSKQAVIDTDTASFTLVDTPGHVDFSAEAERTLPVLDCAILVISGSEGVQSHTKTLWSLLEHHGVPVFIFVNKMDISMKSGEEILSELSDAFGDGFVRFEAGDGTVSFNAENAAMSDEDMLSEYLESGTIRDETVTAAIAGRKLFPCCFGSALKFQGTEDFLRILSRYAPAVDPGAADNPEVSGRIFKISHDEQNHRLTFMKITGGRLSNRSQTAFGKVSGIKIFSGAKAIPVQTAEPGMIVAVSGLEGTRAGMGMGSEEDRFESRLEPVMNCKIITAPGDDPVKVLAAMKILEEEIPELNITWDERQQEIGLRSMGAVQLEILAGIAKARFGFDLRFGRGSILYKERIAGRVEAVGHFEPLRHYSEVHLLMEPGEKGSGITISTDCSTDTLALNWQRLILSHLRGKTHLGILTGSPLTDTKITLVAGRASEKHTSGGDFRQASFRAVRQGLMEAGCELLEPWYDFSIRVPSRNTGRVMTDVQRMGGRIDSTIQDGDPDFTILTGGAPVSTMMDYAVELSSYTRGLGTISTVPGGYDLCHDPETVTESAGYDPQRDVANTPDSVFCESGSGVIVPWYEVSEWMHIPYVYNPARSFMDLNPQVTEEDEAKAARLAALRRASLSEADVAHLDAIFERTYGPVKDRRHNGPSWNTADGVSSAPPSTRKYRGHEDPSGENCLVIDGYNLMHAWPEIAELMKTDFPGARELLIDRLANYRSYTGIRMLLVFDAYKVKGGTGSSERIHGIDVVYTKESQTADSYIEQVTYRIAKKFRVHVVTSDGLEQLIILGNGALRFPSDAFVQEVLRVEEEIREIIRS